MPRQNRGSDSELSYASLVYSFENGDSVIVQENCRSRGSSDDNEDVIFPENFINDDYRAGGPAMVPHPVENFAIPSYAAMKAIEQHPYRTNICDKLNSWGLEIDEYGVMFRQSRDFPEDGKIPTLVIISQKTKRDQSWLNASLEIRNYLVSQGFPEVSVEIADKKAFRPLIISPVERNNVMHSAWGKVCHSMLSELDLHGCRIIECYRSGYSSNAIENQITITVTVDRDSTRKWKPFRDGVIEILKRFGLIGVAVRVTTGRVIRAGDGLNKELPDTLWSRAANLGASMGPDVRLNGSGTFGGYVELKNREGEWKKFGLTCYHVIQPEMKGKILNTANVTRWNRAGIRVGDEKAREVLCPTQPSRADYNKHIQQTQRKIWEAKNDPDYLDRAGRLERHELFGVALTAQIMEEKEINRLSKLLRTSQDFWDSGHAPLGEVFAASGYRTRKAATHGGRVHVDWALIEISLGRMGNNAIDTEGTPKFNLPNEAIQGTRDPADELRVYKLGRTTGWTQGRCSDLESAHLETFDSNGKQKVETTMEHLVMGVGGEPFSLEGDSGAFVFDRALALVGMLFSDHSSKTVSYMTSCKDLFADIMEVTGAKDIRVPI